VVVQGEVTAALSQPNVSSAAIRSMSLQVKANSRRDGVDTLLGDGLPSGLPDILGNSQKVLSGRLESPVRLDGLLDLSVRTWVRMRSGKVSLTDPTVNRAEESCATYRSLGNPKQQTEQPFSLFFW
jgi:hypothetical protein